MYKKSSLGERNTIRAKNFNSSDNTIFNSIELNNKSILHKKDIKSHTIDDILLEFVDFDDTLFPTDVLCKYPKQSRDYEIFDINIYSEKILKDIKKLESNVIEFINLANIKGKLYILTAATESWVRDCIKVFYPNIHNYHMDKFIIISSQDAYGKITKDPTEWKRLAIINELNHGMRTYILSIGDSYYEADASLQIHNDREKEVSYEQPANVYIFKLGEAPTIKNLRSQLKFIIENFDSLITEYEFNTVKHINVVNNN